MKQSIRQLSVGLALMGLCMAILLLSDLDNRESGKVRPKGPLRVAIMQQNAQAIFDNGVAGVIDGLAESGFRHGGKISIRKFNPMGDANLANAIAKEIVEGNYDLIITATSPSLQVVAAANRMRRTPHLFTLVSVPEQCGVGISGTDPLDHPPYLTGYSTRLPAVQGIRIAKEINPRLKRIGTIWNPREPNSEVQIVDARKLCRELGMELIEANVDSTADVAEAAAAVIARRIDAFFIPGDVTVIPAMDNVIRLAERSGIPCFNLFPSDANKGVLFSVGADYYEVGRQTGRLAAEVLNGRNTATIPVTDYMPAKIVLNEQSRLKLPQPDAWDFPPDLVAKAFAIIDAKGVSREQNLQTRQTTDEP